MKPKTFLDLVLKSKKYKSLSPISKGDFLDGVSIGFDIASKLNKVTKPKKRNRN